METTFKAVITQNNTADNSILTTSYDDYSAFLSELSDIMTSVVQKTATIAITIRRKNSDAT